MLQNSDSHSLIMLSPEQRYRHDLERAEFSYDPAQELAVGYLQSLYEQLLVAYENPVGGGGFITRLRLRLLGAAPKQQSLLIKGVYFWGGVGRGKTYLMDNFYESLPFDEKIRTHFHRFMRRVHRELKGLSGEKNPLEKVADNIAGQARVICFDEFFVSDITDAMLLGTLFELLFARHVVLVATSNIPPDNLYQNGLQRQRFLPTIDLLYQHTHVVNVDGGIDYRLRALEQAELYHFPLGIEADKALMAAFNGLVVVRDSVRKDVDIYIEGRKIHCRFVSKGVVWFDFAVICDIPRSQYDYIELASKFYAVLIGSVPQMSRKNDDQARRFINLVDELYDHNVKLVLSAEVDMAFLYTSGRLAFEFQRTQSRLLEMQSHDYLARPCRP